MPERVTPEERLISLAIEKARKAKELLSDPNGLDFTEDEKLEMEKVKRPKAEKVTTKIPNQEKEGYGLAGQEIKKKIDISKPRPFSELIIEAGDFLSSLESLQNYVAYYMRGKFEDEPPEVKSKTIALYNFEVRGIKKSLVKLINLTKTLDEMPSDFE